MECRKTEQIIVACMKHIGDNPSHRITERIEHYQNDKHSENIEEHVLSLEKALRKALEGSELDVLPPSDLSSGMVIAWYPAQHEQAAEAILQKHRIHMSHHAGYLRLSFALHNTVEQVQEIAHALREIGNLK